VPDELEIAYVAVVGPGDGAATAVLDVAEEVGAP